MEVFNHIILILLHGVSFPYPYSIHVWYIFTIIYLLVMLDLFMVNV